MLRQYVEHSPQHALRMPHYQWQMARCHFLTHQAEIARAAAVVPAAAGLARQQQLHLYRQILHHRLHLCCQQQHRLQQQHPGWLFPLHAAALLLLLLLLLPIPPAD
jgi:hypothetical protein